MYRVEIIYGLIDDNEKNHEQELDASDMPIAGDDLEKAQAEAHRYSMWNEFVARYHHAAGVDGKGVPDWKQRTVQKKRVYDRKYTERPYDEPRAARYVIVRVSKAGETAEEEVGNDGT